MIACKVVGRIAVTDEAGNAQTIEVWTLTDTTVRGGRDVTIEKERWYRLSNGPYVSRADDGTFETMPVGGGAGVKLAKTGGQNGGGQG